MKKQSGFTLIELISVIVILGILAATAAPKFSNLRMEAEGTTLKSIRGAMETSVSMAHGMWLAQNLAANSDITFAPGVVISMVNGYPSASAVGIFATLDISSGVYAYNDNAVATQTSGVLYKVAVGTSAVNGTTCGVEYGKSPGLNIPPVISGPAYSGC